MNFSTFKNFQESMGTGIAVVSHQTWSGLVFPPLYPDPLVPMHRFRAGYIERLKKLDAREVSNLLYAMAPDPVLVSNVKMQRDALIEWLK